jgi:hypothetical protein
MMTLTSCGGFFPIGMASIRMAGSGGLARERSGA